MIRKVVEKLKQELSYPINGFYTEEVRKQRVREGFDVVSLGSAKHGVLARKRFLYFPIINQYVSLYGMCWLVHFCRCILK